MVPDIASRVKRKRHNVLLVVLTYLLSFFFICLNRNVNNKDGVITPTNMEMGKVEELVPQHKETKSLLINNNKKLDNSSNN